MNGFVEIVLHRLQTLKAYEENNGICVTFKECLSYLADVSLKKVVNRKSDANLRHECFLKRYVVWVEDFFFQKCGLLQCVCWDWLREARFQRYA